MLEGFEAKRENFTQCLDAYGGEIVVGENTTFGINIVASGID
ncbi:MAG: hypothetical protein OXG26_10855 [Caldilineaceae bacterium]|nr:hypothetical protein [Caldilineaceae bacterium]